MITLVYRDPLDGNRASIDVTDLASSSDGDILGERVWTIRFNSNNDFTANSVIVDPADPHATMSALTPYANFADETPISLNGSQLVLNVAQTFTRGTATITVTRTSPTVFRIKTNHVGFYNVELSVSETFGQPTLPQFITPSDYLTGDSSFKPILERIAVVDNHEPIVDFVP
jgi:hypothetical protein